MGLLKRSSKRIFMRTLICIRDPKLKAARGLAGADTLRAVSSERLPWVTTEEVCVAVGKTRRTILRWSKLGVLPRFELAYSRGKSVRWPPQTIEQARWVDGRLAAGMTFGEIKAALDQGAFKP